MIALPQVIEYMELKEQYLKLSSFIRSLHIHTDAPDLGDLEILRSEMNAISERLSKVITEMDAFEQNDLGMK
tara:strand:- start:7790 stop:8005 length:216 start_codon:yes stop_codon:yes gene_type:complete